MSLLMDALKRAETSKMEATRALTGRDSGTTSTPGLGLEPINQRTESGRQLPDLAQHIDSLNADLEAGVPSQNIPPAGQPAPPQSPLKPTSDDETRAAIRNAFAAKEAKPASRTLLWVLLGCVALAVIGIAAYVIHELQSLNAGSLRTASTQAPQHLESNNPLTPPPGARTPLPAIPIIAPQSPSTASNESNTIKADRPALVTPRASGPRQPSGLTDSGSPHPQLPEIRLTRTQPVPDPDLQRAYANLQANSLDLARHDLEKVLRSDPNNVDALLALGAIAQRQGQMADAEYFQQRALIADPRDPRAQAATLGSNSSGDSQITESRLKSLLAAQPESAQLNFALGNLFAKDGRWNEAQQAYFNAVAGETDNPDYLFNLAVSLDQLRQPKLAIQHYRLALEAADRRPAAFDRQRLLKRLSQLSP